VPLIWHFAPLQIFASWGVDSVGIDYCDGTPETYLNAQPTFQKFADAIAKSGRQMQMGLWNLGDGRPWTWAPKLNFDAGYTMAQQFRVTSDIGNLWEGYGGPTMGVLTTVCVCRPVGWEYSQRYVDLTPLHTQPSHF
jgi:hypothetical protein